MKKLATNIWAWVLSEIGMVLINANFKLSVKFQLWAMKNKGIRLFFNENECKYYENGPVFFGRVVGKWPHS